MTDTELLNWLEAQGNGIALVNDDFGRWAVVGNGFQPLSELRGDDEYTIIDGPIGGEWVYFINFQDWKPTIREAIVAEIGSKGRALS